MKTLRLTSLSLALLCCMQAHAQNQWRNWESPQVHPLERTPDGLLLLAVNTADQRLELFDLPAGGGLPVWRQSIPVGLEPVSVRARSNSEAWVVNQLSDNISVVDLAQARITRTISTGDEPADVVFAGAPQRAWVSVAQLNQLRIYDPSNPASTVQILNLQGEEPRALAVSPDGQRVYVGFFESGNGSTIVEQTDVSNPSGPYAGANPPPNLGNAFSPALAAGLPAPPPVAQIVRKDAGRWRDGNGRDWSAFVGWNLLDHDIAAIETSTLAISHIDQLMTTVMALGVRPDGRIAAVGTEALNQVRFEPNVQSTFIRVRIASASAAALTSPTLADLNPQLDYLTRSVPMATRMQAIGDPRGIVWHPSGDTAYISGMGSNNVILSDSLGTRLGRIPVGQGPTGLVLNTSGSRLYVLNRFDASISSIDTAARSELGRVSFFDPTSSAVKLGRPMLYDTHAGSGLGQASCASCHVDGRSDFLAWDLGDPAGAMKTVNQPCRQGQACRPWHPMKGPLVTQVLQGIVGNGAMHWRGDREDIAAFANAFVSLQGADAAPSTTQMQQFEAFVASLLYPPNPNRNFDGSFPLSLAVTGGTGSPANGLQLFQTLPVLAGNATCESCHALPTGTSKQIDDPNLPLAPQSMKQAQLRGLWKKNGWSITRQDNTRGFGFNGDSEFDTLNALLLAGFNFGAQAQAPQRRRDMEAFMLAFDSETTAPTGSQLLFDGSNNNNATDLARLTSMQALADTGQLGLIAQRNEAGNTRGWVYATQNLLLSDQENQVSTVAALREAASASAPLLFTVVAPFTQYRAGVDRDADGWFDQDERNKGTDPANAQNQPLPSAICKADFNADGRLDSLDSSAFLSAFNSLSVRANYDHSLASSGLPAINDLDRIAFEADFAAGCATENLLANGFE